MSTQSTHPLAKLPYFALSDAQRGTVPNDEECFALWDTYNMRDNVREHSHAVAELATLLAVRAKDIGHNVCVASVRACALLHDIGKSYTINHGGSHAQIGASWIVSATGNRALAQGVIMHVHWPWAIPENVCTVPFFVIYADKRIMHDTCVTLEERYEDLQTRYGHTDVLRASIHESYLQGKQVERALSAQLEWNLDAYTLNSGRLVQRT